MALRRIILLVILTTLPAFAALAQQPPRNAADLYREAFALMEQRLSPADWDLIRNYTAGAVSGFTPEVQDAIRRAQPVIRKLEQASQLDHVDWGIDFSQGPGTLLPHLSPLRDATHLLAADANARLASGDGSGAARAIAAGIHMSDHSTQGPVLISTLVGAAIYRTIDMRVLDQAIGAGTLDMHQARAVLGAIDDILHGDPFRFTESIEGERLGMAGWMIENFTGEGGHARLLESMDMFIADADDPFALAVAGMNQGELDASIVQYDAALAAMGEAMANDDLGAAMREVRALVERAEAGGFGPIAAQMLPAIDRVIATMLDLYGQIEERIGELETIAASSDGRLTMRNAALWYLRAIEQHDGIPDDIHDLLEARPDRLADAAHEKLVPALAEAETIVAILLEAVEIERCDFDLEGLWDRQGLRVALEHVPGMERNANLLRAVAFYTLQGQAADDAQRQRIEKLLLALPRMSRHLGGDDRTRSVRGAALILDCACDVLEYATHAPAFERLTASDRNAIESRAAAALRESAEALLQAQSRTLLTYRAVTTGWLLDSFAHDYGGRLDTVITELAELASNASEPARLDMRAFGYDDAKAMLIHLDRLVTRALEGAEDHAKLIAEFAAAWPDGPARWLIEPLGTTAATVNATIKRVRAATRTAE